MTRYSPATATTSRADRLADEDGAAVLEFAIVATVLLAILYGIVSFGVLLAVEHSLTHAAAEGARAAVGAADGQEVATSADATRDAIGWLAGWVEPSDVTSSISTCSYDATLDCVRVRIDYPYSSRPVLPAFPLVGFVIPDNVRTEAVASVS